MIVYLKEPMGYTSLCGYRIYGKKFGNGSFGCTEVPREIYQANREILEEAEYTKEWLEEKFGREFPTIKFKCSDLSRLDINDLILIAHGLGIEFKRKKSYSLQDKNGLKRSILNNLL